ncbi:uncharacterized protein LOC131440440 [Malaya genurostris]|uniref:uncharacterized protein LOC131440440 n=1 Tax=Malaya genurostris TaxID=325434 RepID=UPI0026F3EF9B|nr:uncharacterized protein LOC131440440 [Malaya genurostris]
MVIENFERLVELNSQTRFMSLYFDYMAQNINPSSFVSNRAHFLDTSDSTVFFDTSMREEIRGIPDHIRPQVAPNIFYNKLRTVNCEKVFYTDGSNINESTGFGIFNQNITASYKLSDPASVYVAELAAIQYTLEIIETLPKDHYFIVTDSLSSIEALRAMKPGKYPPYFLGKTREHLRTLSGRSYSISLVWVPSHCSIPGNEKADSLAKVGALEGDIYERPICFNEFFSISRQKTLESWQTSWTNDELGRWLHAIIPKVSTKPWFKGMNVSRDFIRVMSRLMSNHYTFNAHLRRIGLVESNLCTCGDGYQDIEHVVWSCVEYRDARSKLLESLRARGRPPEVPVRDVLASRDSSYMLLIYQFLKHIRIQV